MRAVDLVGQRFGRLLVLSFAESRAAYDGRKVRFWNCVCDCGKGVVCDFQSRERKSCGCAKVAANRLNPIKHGHKLNGRRSPTLSSYTAMLERCSNQNNIHYHLYGGRGISVCERWRGEDGFKNFLADIGHRPKGKTIDRKD